VQLPYLKTLCPSVYSKTARMTYFCTNFAAGMLKKELNDITMPQRDRGKHCVNLERSGKENQDACGQWLPSSTQVSTTEKGLV